MGKTIALAAILSGAALAQGFHNVGMRVRNGVVTAMFGPPPPVGLVTGAPYSAEHRMPDGQRVIGRYARDSQGRVRIEAAHKMGFWTIAIYDPAAEVAYLLDQDKKVAHRMKLPPPTPNPGPSGENLEIGVVRGYKMSKFSRQEPSAALFRPPADYQIVDEPKPFAMTIPLR